MRSMIWRRRRVRAADGATLPINPPIWNRPASPCLLCRVILIASPPSSSPAATGCVNALSARGRIVSNAAGRKRSGRRRSFSSPRRRSATRRLRFNKRRPRCWHARDSRRTARTTTAATSMSGCSAGRGRRATFSWVEPTAWACLALRRIGQGQHPRVEEGSKLLLDRALANGGVNYGNRRIFGIALEPIPGPTAVMLLALQGRPDDPRDRRQRGLSPSSPPRRATTSNIFAGRAWRWTFMRDHPDVRATVAALGERIRAAHAGAGRNVLAAACPVTASIDRPRPRHRARQSLPFAEPRP